MGKLIDVDALAGANFRTGIGLMKFIDSLPEAVTRCEKCEYFDPPTHDPQHFCGDMGVCKVHNMYKKPESFCDGGKPREAEDE